MIPGKVGRTGMLLLIALLSLSLLVLSWPRFLAAFRYLPVEHALNQYYADSEIPSDRLPILIRFAGEAIDIHDHHRYRDGLSRLHHLRALDVNTPARERREAWRSAEAEAMNSLRLAPAQSALWLQLATIRWVLHDEPGTIVEPWKMSVYTGRTHSSLYLRRIEIGLAHLEDLDTEGVAMLRSQLRLAWTARPGALANLLARLDRDLGLVRKVMKGSEPEMMAEVEAWLERIR